MNWIDNVLLLQLSSESEKEHTAALRSLQCRAASDADVASAHIAASDKLSEFLQRTNARLNSVVAAGMGTADNDMCIAAAACDDIVGDASSSTTSQQVCQTHKRQRERTTHASHVASQIGTTALLSATETCETDAYNKGCCSLPSDAYTAAWPYATDNPLGRSRYVDATGRTVLAALPTNPGVSGRVSSSTCYRDIFCNSQNMPLFFRVASRCYPCQSLGRRQCKAPPS